MRKRKRRILIPGPVLIGFYETFDKSFGDPATPRPYPKVTPSIVGGVLLPFQCPHCGAVCPEVVDARKRGQYHDFERDFSFCPACAGRYVLNLDGVPLAESLPAGATHAPAVVERRGKAKMVGAPEPEDDLNTLGAVS